MNSSRLAIVCLTVLFAASIWVLLAARRAAMRGAGAVDGLHLVSAQFRSCTNSMGDEVIDVSLTVSNASPTCLVFRLASLDWMVNNTDEYGSFGGLADSVGTLPCGATTTPVMFTLVRSAGLHNWQRVRRGRPRRRSRERLPPSFASMDQ
jgi:hypothetical protein